MSAIRRGGRRMARDHHSSPYSRPNPKKSPWTIAGIFSYLIPFRSFGSSKELPDESTELINGIPVITNSMVDEELLQNLDQESHAPSSPPHSTVSVIPPPDPVPVRSSSSPADNFETATMFRHQKAADQSSLPIIQRHTASEETSPEYTGRKPFRFTSVPATPRPQSPNPSSSSTPKLLNKNPNGVYRWEGAGSARPRNRYRSPAFGSSRPSGARIKLSPPDITFIDTKKRRLNEGVGLSSSSTVPVASASTNRMAAPAIAPLTSTEHARGLPFPVSNGASPAINGTSLARKPNRMPPRLRTTGLPANATAPAKPSPLRQAWGQSESDSSPPPSIRSTKAASFMTELIKEVTPPKKPDVSNPYQTASPVKPPPRKPVRRLRATGRPTVPAPVPAPTKMKEPEILPQAIIEATVPKGSKRSRPPARVGKSFSVDDKFGKSSGEAPFRRGPPPESTFSAVNGSSRLRKARSPPIVIEDDDDEQDPPAPKRQKSSPAVNGINHKTPRKTVTIEEVDDVDMPLALPPIRPAQVIEVEDNPSPKPTQSVLASAFPPSNPSTSSESESLTFASVRPAAVEAQDKAGPKPAQHFTTTTSSSSNMFGSSQSLGPAFSLAPPARVIDIDDKPDFKYDATPPSNVFGSSRSVFPSVGPAPVTAVQDDKPTPPVPTSAFAPSITFGLSQSGSGVSFGTKSSAPKEPSKLRFSYQPEPTSASPPRQPTKETKAKIDPRESALAVDVDSLPTYAFVVSSASPMATSRHVIARSTAKVASVSSLPTFDFSTPSKPIDGTTAVQEKPVISEKAAPAVLTFDWAAAGMKPPTKTGTWTCSLCMLDNVKSAVDKCKFCDTPR